MAIKITGLNSGLDVDSMISSLTSSYKVKIDDVKKQQDSIQYKIDSWSSLNSKIYSFYSGTLSKNRFKNSFGVSKHNNTSNALEIKSLSSNSNHNLQILNMSQTGYMTGKKLNNVSKDTKINTLGIENGTYKLNNKDIVIDDNTTLSNLTNQLKDSDINLTFDDNQKRVFLMANKSGVKNDFDLSENSSSKELLNVLGLNNSYYLDDNGNYYEDKNMLKKIENQDLIQNIKNGNSSVRILGKNSNVLLDGVSYISETNDFKINDLEFTIKDVSNENIKISSNRNTNDIINNIKSFIEEYNSLMKEMSTSYNTSSDGYKPLTEDERDKMSESQIKKWEDKLKNSALYKDYTLNSLIQKTHSSMMQGININGETQYLHQYGIKTNSYLSSNKEERNLFSIDENKLRKMLEENEDDTLDFFSKLADKLYKTLDSSMNSNKTYSSSYKVYNDKLLSSKKESFNKDISKLEDRMTKMEDKYYKQFAAMEKAFTNLNSQSNYFSMFFNTNI